MITLENFFSMLPMSSRSTTHLGCLFIKNKNRINKNACIIIKQVYKPEIS